VDTLCGPACPQVSFELQRDTVFVTSGDHNITLTQPNVLVCPGRWVVHEVDGFLLVNVTDPAQAALPALVLGRTLGGEFDTFPLLER
jgi:hypothetical protein